MTQISQGFYHTHKLLGIIFIEPCPNLPEIHRKQPTKLQKFSASAQCVINQVLIDDLKAEILCCLEIHLKSRSLFITTTHVLPFESERTIILRKIENLLASPTITIGKTTSTDMMLHMKVRQI